jgi:hypothetical protein
MSELGFGSLIMLDYFFNCSFVLMLQCHDLGRHKECHQSFLFVATCQHQKLHRHLTSGISLLQAGLGLC